MKKIIQISSLYSLSSIEDYYYINKKLDVLNINTNYVKKATLGKRDGYYYYTLQSKDKKQKKVYVHKIHALAFIRNSEYTLINHIDGDKTNNDIHNLEFSNHSKNALHAIKLGMVKYDSEIFKLKLKSKKCYIGTMVELSEKTGIPQGTLYDNLYQKRDSRTIKSIYAIGQQTNERVSGA